MPQLSIETFVTQYAWLMVILLTFYYFNVTEFIPRVSETLKLRNKIENEQEETSKEESNQEGKKLVSEMIKGSLIGEESKREEYETNFKKSGQD